MRKKHMEKNTIFFIGDKFCRAFDYEVYKNRFNEINDLIKNPKKIFYKVNDDFNSWIKYKEAMQNLSGTYQDRINKALESPAFRLSSELTELPACIYMDSEGYEHYIMPNDGQMIDSYWIDREDIIHDYPTITLLKQGTEEKPRYDIKMKFNWDITDAFISLNSFFYDFDILGYNEVIFRNVGELLPNFIPLDRLESSEKTYYETEVSIIKWAGTRKSKRVYPEMRNENIFTFKEEVDEHVLFFYNGIYYRHELVNKNSNNKSKEVKILDLDASVLEYIDLDMLYYIKLLSVDDKCTIKKYEMKGTNNVFPNEVHFSQRINDAMITCNGRDISYLIKDKYSIEYPVFSNSLGDLLSNNSNVYATLFYVGLEGMGAGTDSGYNPEDIFDIIGNTNSAIESVKPKMNDYSDFLEFNEENINEFFLEFKPIKNTVRLVINGVRYEEGVHFSYLSNNNSIVWLFTRERGGFDLQLDFKVVAVYDFIFAENGISPDNVDEFMREYIRYLTKMELMS